MPEIGIEPTRTEVRWILSPLRLPVPPLGHAQRISQFFALLRTPPESLRYVLSHGLVEVVDPTLQDGAIDRACRLPILEGLETPLCVVYQR